MPVSFVEFQVEYLAAGLAGLPPGLYYTKLSPPKFLPKAALPCLTSVDWSCEFTDDPSLTVELNKFVSRINTTATSSKWKVCFWTTTAGSENAVAKFWMVLSLAMAQEIHFQSVFENRLKRYYSFRGQALLDLNCLRTTIRDLPDGLVSMKDERWDSWAAAAEATLKSGLVSSEPTGVHGDGEDPSDISSTWPHHKPYQPYRPKWPWYGLDPPGPISDSQVQEKGTRDGVRGMKGDNVPTSKAERPKDAVVQSRAPVMPSSSGPNDLRSELQESHQSVQVQKSAQQNIPKAANSGKKDHSSSLQLTEGSASTTSRAQQQQATPLQHENINELRGPKRFDYLLSQGLVPTGPKSLQTSSTHRLHKSPHKSSYQQRPKFAPSRSTAFHRKPLATPAQHENAQQKDAQQENAQQENAQQENAQQENAQQENAQQEDAKHKDAQQANAQQEDAQQENAKHEEAKDAEQHDALQENVKYGEAPKENARQEDTQQKTSPRKQKTPPDTEAADREPLLPDGSVQNSPSRQDSAAPPSASAHEQAEGRRAAVSHLTLATERRNAQSSSHKRVDSSIPKRNGLKMLMNPYPFAGPGKVWNVPSYYHAEERRDKVDEAIDMSEFPLRWLPTEVWEEIGHLGSC